MPKYVACCCLDSGGQWHKLILIFLGLMTFFLCGYPTWHYEDRSKWPAALPVFPPCCDSCAAQPDPALGSQHPCPYTVCQPDPDPQCPCHFWPQLKFWCIFLTQQDLEKSHSLCEWFPKHWAPQMVAGPSAGCLHSCRLGATDRINPPQPLCHLYVWYAFFKKAIPECPKAKKCVFDPNLDREMKACLWRFMPQVVHSHFMLVFSLPYLGKRKKSLETCTSHKQVSYQREKKEYFHSLTIPRNSYEIRGKRTVPVYPPWFFKWGCY